MHKFRKRYFLFLGALTLSGALSAGPDKSTENKFIWFPLMKSVSGGQCCGGYEETEEETRLIEKQETEEEKRAREESEDESEDGLDAGVFCCPFFAPLDILTMPLRGVWHPIKAGLRQSG